MSDWGRLVEDQIQQAMQEGVFDNLPGKGQPLKLDDNPFGDSAAWTAHHLLRANGYTLPWIEEGRAIETEVEAARVALARAYQWVQAGLGRTPPDRQAERRWLQAQEAFREEVIRLNRRIRDHNLKVPLTQFQLCPMNAERELAQAAVKARAVGVSP